MSFMPPASCCAGAFSLAAANWIAADDVLIAGAAAQISRNAHADFIVRRVRDLLQQPVGTDDHARRAEAALQAVHLAKALLQRMQRAIRVGDALDGEHLRALGLNREHGAGSYRLAVEIDGAGAAVAGLAADMRAGEPRVSRRK